MSDDLTEEQKEKLREMIDTWDTTRGAVRALKVIGVVLRWFVGLGASFAVIYGVLHGGSPK